jgi:hypothetical protein
MAGRVYEARLYVRDIDLEEQLVRTFPVTRPFPPVLVLSRLVPSETKSAIAASAFGRPDLRAEEDRYHRIGVEVDMLGTWVRYEMRPELYDLFVSGVKIRP